MAAPANPRVSAEEYLEIERLAEFKSEFLNGEALARSGDSARHALIAANVIRTIGQAARPRGCTTFSSDLRIGIENSAYFYPDASIVCGEPEILTSDQDILTNPAVIVEVLSPSTEAYDRGDKFHAYRQVESLKHYLLISQSSRTVDVISRRDAVWVIETFSGEEEITLESLGVTVSLQDLYDGVAFSEGPADDRPRSGA